MPFRLALSLLLASASLALAQTPSNDPLPTQQDVRDAYLAADYPKTLQLLNRVLILKGKAAEPYDRHALLVIKGETHLRIRGGAAAAEQAFGEASKEAADGPTAAIDIATEMLIKRANAGLAYQPRAKDPTDKTKTLAPISIVEPADRKQAIEALYVDERAVVEPRMKAAAAGRTLTAILETLPQIRNLRWLEMASTGKDDASRAAAAGLIDKAKKLTNEALDEMNKSFEPIEIIANEVIDARVPILDKQTGKFIRFDLQYKRRGPTNRQVATLQEAFATCGKIFASCDELGGSLGTTGKEFDETKIKAEVVGGKAKRFLDTDWRATFQVPPPPVK